MIVVPKKFMQIKSLYVINWISSSTPFRMQFEYPQVGNTFALKGTQKACQIVVYCALIFKL